MTREEDERIFGRLRAVGVRLHRKLYADDAEVKTVPDLILDTDEGFTVEMVDGWGKPCERIHLDKHENIVRREPAKDPDGLGK